MNKILDNNFNDHVFGTKISSARIPNMEFPKDSMNSKIAYEMINEILLLEGSSRSNLATFCQTYMEQEAIDLMTSTMSKNAIDKSEYPQVTAIEQKCVNMLADLWHTSEKYIGTSTVGSSEACMLAGIAMKKRFLHYRENNNLPVIKRPNLIISSANQVCWEKFSVYFDVDLKIISVDDISCTMNPKHAIDAIDEYTIGIVGILGITYTGMYDDIQTLDILLQDYNHAHDFEIYIHVDAASGGLYAPFVQEDLIWDFKLPTVASINTSGHKYGLVYPGIGWVLFRDERFVSPELRFDVNYLGGTVTTMSINFSHSASNLVAQYYNFIRLGFEGYADIHQKTKLVANKIAEYLESTGLFEIINDGNKLPLVCYKLKDGHQANWNLYDLSDQLLQHGWQIPTYPLSANMEDIIIQRIVCRSDLTMEMAYVLINDFTQAINFLNTKNITMHEAHNKPYGFTH